MGGPRPKQLLPLAGRPVIEHSIAAYCAAPEVDDVIVLMVADHVPEVEELVAEGGYGKVSAVLPGGADRSSTSWRAVQALQEGGADDVLLLHDAVRPLVAPAVIGACAAEARRSSAAGVAVPAGDTIVEVEARSSPPGTGERILHVPSRSALRRMQTPQGFRLETIRRAYELAWQDPGFAESGATDDCGVVLRYLPEVAVAVVPGEERNIKITHPGDLRIAEALLEKEG